jgi:hypothetical protein
VKITAKNVGRDRRYPITNKFRETLGRASLAVILAKAGILGRPEQESLRWIPTCSGTTWDHESHR